MTLIAGRGLDFRNGQNDYVSIPNHADLQLTTYAIDIWVYPRTFIDWCGIFAKAHNALGAPGNNYQIIMRDINKWHLAVGFGGALFAYLEIGVVNLNAWNYLTVVFDNSNDLVSAYQNGALYDTHVEAGVPFLGVMPLYIGCAAGAAGLPSGYCDAIIDEVRLSNDVRTLAEHVANWNSGNGKGLIADSITAGLWHMNEGTGGSVIYDKTANDHDGDITGATWVAGKVKHTGAVWDYFSWA